MIEARGLRRLYRPERSLGGLGPRRGASVVALADASPSVAGGEIVGVARANGSGKSTLLRVIAGMILPDRGSVSVAGCDPVDDRIGVARHAALVTGEERSFYWRLSGRRNLELFGALCGLPSAAAAERSHEVLGRVGLTYAADRRVLAYSSGMRQRLAVARALVREPRVLLLDELTRALDEEGTTRLWELVQAERRRGVAVLAAATRAVDLETRCDRLLFVEAGALVEEAPAAVVGDIG